MWVWWTRPWPAIWTAFYKLCLWPRSSEMHCTSKYLFSWSSLYCFTKQLYLMRSVVRKLFYSTCPLFSPAGNLRSRRKTRSPASLTSYRGCFCCCRPVRRGPSRPPTWPAASAGTAAKVGCHTATSRQPLPGSLPVTRRSPGSTSSDVLIKELEVWGEGVLFVLSHSSLCLNWSVCVSLLWCLRICFVAWQQHDVQELCRVMFDALEQKWKQTEQVWKKSEPCHLSKP